MTFLSGRLKETLINSSARLSVISANGFVTASRRSPAAPSSHFLAIRKNASAIAQTHLISVSLTFLQFSMLKISSEVLQSILEQGIN